MSRFIESIALDHGVFNHLTLHQERVDNTLRQFFPNSEINLKEVLTALRYPVNGLYKCRIVYGRDVEDIEFIPYQRKGIQSLKVVRDNSIEYHFKYYNRQLLESLYSQRADCDDILIVKNGFITDSSYSNVIFFDGKHWITPDTYLLNGVMRQYLLGANKISEARIMVNDIKYFKTCKLINALLGLHGPEIDVSRIVL